MPKPGQRIDTDRQMDARLKENRVLRLFAYRQWQELNKTTMRKKDILDFYTQYKYIMLAHSRHHYKEIGQLLAKVDEIPLEELKARFMELFIAGLTKLATRGTHANVLFHIQGYLKNKLDKAETASLTALISSYQIGYIPLITPVTMIKYFLQKNPDNYLAKQKYFEPYPAHLGLRSHI